MPTFNLLLAHDRTCYSTVSVDAETWEEGVASLERDDWYSDRHPDDGYGFSERVVYVEDDVSDILAKDIGWDDAYIHTFSLDARINQIVRDHHTGEGTAAMVEALKAMLAEFEAGRRHQLFRKGEEA